MDYFIKLYQSHQYDKKPPNMFYHINLFLRTNKIIIKQKDLKKYKFNTKNEFIYFILNATNNLINYIHLNSYNIKYVYRGERRSKFNIKKGTIICSKQFISTTNNISYASNFIQIYKFDASNMKKNKSIIFIIKLPKNTKILKIDEYFEYTMFDKVKCKMNENELILPPFSYFKVIDITKEQGFNETYVVKMALVYQDFYIIKNLDDKYKPKKIKLKKNIKPFNDKQSNDFIKYFRFYFDKINELYDIKHSIRLTTYNILSYYEDIFIWNIKKLTKKQKNMLLSAMINNNIKKELKYINKIKELKPNCSGTNITGFIGFQKNKKNYLKSNNTLWCNLLMDELVNAGLSTNFYPDRYCNNKLHYNKYILKLNVDCKSVLIVRSKKFMNVFNTCFLVIPPYDYTFVGKTKLTNKWNLPIIIYEFNIFNT